MEVKTAAYQGLKDKGAVRLVKLTPRTFAFVIKRFDQNTGETAPDAIEQVDLDELKKERDVVQAKLDGLNQMIADMEAVEPA